MPIFDNAVTAGLIGIALALIETVKVVTAKALAKKNAVADSVQRITMNDLETARHQAAADEREKSRDDFMKQMSSDQRKIAEDLSTVTATQERIIDRLETGNDRLAAIDAKLDRRLSS